MSRFAALARSSVVCLLALGLASGVDAPIGHVNAARAREARFPVPPIPPAQTPSTDAPIPDMDQFDPLADPPPASRLSLDTGINHRAAPGPGYGYAPGAHYQIDKDKGALTLPGIRLRVPIP